jgi:hypothetical protein
MKQSDVDREIEHMIANRKHYSNTNNPIDFPKSKNKMNERIRLLAEQSMGTRKHVPPVWQFFDDELQKFAELIVRECADLFPSADSGTTGIGVVIKQHFGIRD